MGDLSNYVSLVISQATVGIARAGFGIPLILSHKSLFPDRLRFYTGLAGMIADGFTTTSAEYRAASKMFSQSPHPERIAVGRATATVTQVYSMAVSSVRNSFAYQLLVKGEGFTDATVTFTSDGTATNDEIIAGLVTQLNLVASKNYTAAVVDNGTSDTLTITGNAAGNWFSVEIVDVTALTIAQTHTVTNLADDLNAIALANNTWYALYTLFNSNSYVLQAAAWTETVKKVYAADVNETLAITTTASGGNDTLEDLLDFAYARTFGNYHPSPADMMGAAWLGARLPLPVGSETWKFAQLSGVNAVNLTATHRQNLIDRHANSYENVTDSVNVTFEGTTADGDFIDVQRSLDALDDAMRKAVFGSMVNGRKIPYTNPGIAVIEGAMRGVLREFVTNGALDGEEPPQVAVPKVADISPSVRATRVLPDCNFMARMAGAIHKVNVIGTISF